jgi:ribokinase
MATVVSVGSINVDRIARLDSGDVAALADRYDWFPAPGATRPVEDVPARIGERIDETAIGGKGANQAVAAARAGADVSMVGAVGPDGDDALAALNERGVDTSAVERVTPRTGTAYVFVEPDGQNRIAIVEGANGAVSPLDSFETIRNADAVLLQNEIPLDANRRLLDRLDGLADPPTVVLDPAPPEGAGDLLAHSSLSVVTPNDDEYRALGPALSSFPGRTVVTRGGEDVLIENGGRERISVPAADPVDTTGAGDAFAGYLAAELARGESLESAVSTAARAASRATETVGAQRAVPRRSELWRRSPR